MKMNKIVGVSFGIITFWVIFVMVAASEKDNAALPTEKVRSLLLDDDRPNYKEITALGTKAIPGLMEIIQTSKNSLEIRKTLKAISRLSVDRKVFTESICSLLNNNNHVVRMVAIETLGDINATEKAAQVAVLLDDKAEDIRIIALRTLARIGDETSALKIGNSMKKRKEVLTSGQLEQDKILLEGEKAEQEIQKRLKTKESGGINPDNK
jgi:HEAT repeat protein